MRSEKRTPWTSPSYSRGEVDRAGTLLARRPQCTQDELAHALDVINNWRSSHSFPLNTLQMNLRVQSSRIADDWLVAQRLKRVSSIYEKLRRFPKMNLSRMQDIGGARAVLPTLDDVYSLTEAYSRSRMKHALAQLRRYSASFWPISGAAASLREGRYLICLRDRCTDSRDFPK